jgi:membrane-bound lytic murein transglycosylase B
MAVRFCYADKNEGWLVRPDGEDGPIYIVFDNFLRLLEW